jgi:hypothetical protein
VAVVRRTARRDVDHSGLVLANAVDAMTVADRKFISVGVSPDYLRATVVICDAALEYGHLGLVVTMSQMTVSQMRLTSVGESVFVHPFGQAFTTNS